MDSKICKTSSQYLNFSKLTLLSGFLILFSPTIANSRNAEIRLTNCLSKSIRDVIVGTGKFDEKKSIDRMMQFCAFQYNDFKTSSSDEQFNKAINDTIEFGRRQFANIGKDALDMYDRYSYQDLK
jgi:hypothetical protein